MQDFRYDIVGKLPAEIVFILVPHLDVATLFRCQSVSRRWKEILGSHEIINETSKPWNRRGECELVMCDKSPVAVANTKAEHIYAFCTGKAFSKTTGRCVCDYHRKWHLPTVAYCDGRLAWLHAQMDRAWLQNLYTGEQKVSRGQWMAIALSASLVVCVSRFDVCSITRLSNLEKIQHLSIQSSKLVRVVATGRIVAMLCKHIFAVVSSSCTSHFESQDVFQK